MKPVLVFSAVAAVLSAVLAAPLMAYEDVSAVAPGGKGFVGLNLTGVYNFNRTWAVAGVVSYTRMLNDAEDSPLVEGNQGVGDKNQPSGVLAVLYSF